MKTSTKLSYLGLIVAAIMFFYGILGIISGLAPLIIVGIPYGLDDMQFAGIAIQNLLSGIILVIPGIVLYWKSKLIRKLIRELIRK